MKLWRRGGGGFRKTLAIRDLRSQSDVASSREAWGPSFDYHLGTPWTIREPASTLVTEDGRFASTVVSALRDADPFRRMHRLFTIAAGLDRGQLAEAMAESSPSTDRSRLQPILLGRWLDVDPSTAFEWVRGLSTGLHRDSLLKGRVLLPENQVPWLNRKRRNLNGLRFCWIRSTIDRRDS